MMDEAERKECDFFTTYLDNYAADDDIFSKSKTYSLTDSLLVRIAIASGVQILGYEKFWSSLFTAFDLDVDINLYHLLR